MLWKQSLPSVLPCPRSTFLGMCCVAMEMTLAIYISNDLKQFTSQLKQDLSPDNPKEIVTKRGRGSGKWISLLRSAPWLQLAPCCPVLFGFVCRGPFHVCSLPQNPEQVCIKFRLHFGSLLSSSVVVSRTFIQSAPSAARCRPT